MEFFWFNKNGKNRIGTDFPLPDTGTRITFGTVPGPLSSAWGKNGDTTSVCVLYQSGTVLIPKYKLHLIFMRGS